MVFVVASETITVNDSVITLPGIGSYVGLAIKDQNLPAVGYALLTMLLVIIFYDQLLFRPIVAWADKFRFEQTVSASSPNSWVLDLFRRTKALRIVIDSFEKIFSVIGDFFQKISFLPNKVYYHSPEFLKVSRYNQQIYRVMGILWISFVFFIALYISWKAFEYLHTTLRYNDVLNAINLGLITLLRVAFLVVIATLIWVPIGTWIGLRPKISAKIQPLAQFLAAFPANIAFPPFVAFIVYYKLNPNIWLSSLMILGTQWYILFNVIAGASAFPNDLREVAKSFHVKGWRWWKNVIIPGIFPYYITGAITAFGGAWNASIVSEVVSWGDMKLSAKGLGAYIAKATEEGNIPETVLGIVVMCLFVLLFNRFLWRPLYIYSERHFRFD
ncbi:ABC-type anion transport system, duplicated permease component [Liberibacter crescens BT-1]|uniref:ABC-type anion transport system, duplicated permease component n=1 Tax=Liberibacter crescens (strain BT-1) TaxID=1215343 RepID=L0EXP4_LIBCB|nr:ABC-type anion transport system, duplicated permease component [Liberibacter crescens BT-1]